MFISVSRKLKIIHLSSSTSSYAFLLQLVQCLLMGRSKLGHSVNFYNHIQILASIVSYDGGHFSSPTNDMILLDGLWRIYLKTQDSHQYSISVLSTTSPATDLYHLISIKYNPFVCKHQQTKFKTITGWIQMRYHKITA